MFIFSLGGKNTRQMWNLVQRLLQRLLSSVWPVAKSSFLLSLKSSIKVDTRYQMNKTKEFIKDHDANPMFIKPSFLF